MTLQNQAVYCAGRLTTARDQMNGTWRCALCGALLRLVRLR